MNALILLLFAADPTGLQAAFESAETVDLSYGWTGFKVTLVNPETIKKLAPLAEVKGEAIQSNGIPGTHELIRVAIRGKKTTEFWMVKNKIAFGDHMMIDPADDKLWVALRAYFEPPLADREPPEVQESMQKTLTNAMKKADKLEVTYRKVKIDFPAGPDGIRNVHLSNLKVAGDMTYYAKKPEDPVEVVFVNKETRMPIYLVGDTAYWGEGKSWKSVRLTRDSMWSQMVSTVPPKGSKPSVKVNDPSWQPDAPFLKESIEEASEVKVSFGKDTISLKDAKEIAKLVKSDGKAVDASDRAGKDFLHIQLGTTHYRLFSDDVLVNGESATAVVGIKLDHDLWKTLRSRFK